jgi:hypothetical protein
VIDTDKPAKITYIKIDGETLEAMALDIWRPRMYVNNSTMSAHPDLRKMGLHAVPPGGDGSVIIANYNTSRIGLRSSDSDKAVMATNKTVCTKKEDGSYYGLKLPLRDASGHNIGILVMEMPYTSASEQAEAIRKAEVIRSELAQRIASADRLFE